VPGEREIYLPNVGIMQKEEKGKERKSIYTTHSLKVLRYTSHRFTCKLHHTCLSFVGVHYMAPPLTEVADIELLLTSHLSTRKDGRLSWPGWLTYSGRFTHINGRPSATLVELRIVKVRRPKTDVLPLCQCRMISLTH